MKPVMLALVMIVALAGCATTERRYSADAQDPNLVVRQILSQWKKQLASGVACQDDNRSGDLNDCDDLMRRLFALYSAFPRNERVQFAIAVVSYHTGRYEQAGNFLDQVLRGQRPRSEATALRARIALEQGNVERARTLLNAQIQLHPMDSMLHELMASVYFMDQHTHRAFEALAVSQRLGAPLWRIAYHRGLLFEQSGNQAAACEHYAEAFSRRPDFQIAQGRLVALADHVGCFELAKLVGERS
ncbi:hypothetical protein [Marinobacter sp. SS21]|uniref:hypothetical protein n=1 Tax=Marinobacter sp. SS21 TaxID=2979460 RepID=UPI00232AF67F|nr:hypothetical protein [Marinobacter sp. SS21]MDC0662278.1 hypothetical protein [Marinobacter sp. SS21]